MKNSDFVNSYRRQIDNIRFTPSPINTKPRLFPPNILFDKDTFDRIQSGVYDLMNELNDGYKEEEEEEEEEEHQHHNTNIEHTYILSFRFCVSIIRIIFHSE